MILEHALRKPFYILVCQPIARQADTLGIKLEFPDVKQIVAPLIHIKRYQRSLRKLYRAPSAMQRILDCVVTS